MAERRDPIRHEPSGVATGKVVAATAIFLSLILIALATVGLMFAQVEVAYGPTPVEMPIVHDQPRLQVKPADDLIALRKAHEAQLEEGPVTIEKAMDFIARRADPFAPVSDAERQEVLR